MKNPARSTAPPPVPALRRALPGSGILRLFLFATLAFAGACAPRAHLTRSPAPLPKPPRAAVVPEQLSAHGQVRTDEYYWLRDREDPQVLAYLEAENAYTTAVMAHTGGLQETLFQEMKDRIKKDDSTVPYLYDGYYYYDRYEAEAEYPLYCRRAGSLDAPEEVLLDVNALAAPHEYFAVWGREVSSDGRTYAFAQDTLGRRFFTIRFKDLQTGGMHPDVIDSVSSNLAWAEDADVLFYTRQDPETLRHYRIYRHTLGTPSSTDALVYQEDDDTFDCFVWKSKSREYLFIGAEQTLTSEYRCLEADDPTGEFRILEPRERGHEYTVEHCDGYFYYRSNWNAQNFRLLRAPVAAPGREHWEEVVPHRPDVLLERAEPFRDFLALSERALGLTRLRVIRWDGSDDHYLDFGEPAYLAYIDVNAELDVPYLRYGYTSLVTPWSVYDYDPRTRATTLRKQQEVLGGYDPSAYRSERLWASARDGTRIPISLVYPRDLPRDGSAPLLLYAYGSYGASEDAIFSPSRISLLQRGCAYAVAHVRGGEELGRSWYEDGKLLKKRNTFTDFIDCANFLIAERYTCPARLFANGASAGGLLMGAVTNMAPELFRGIVAEVPFVDVVTTMLDSSIPLTTSEYDEWGDPRDPVYFDYLLSYSPYDNVVAKEYPHLLVTAGLHDSQVQYWEPAKWVARLRARKTGDQRLLLWTNMEAGHGGVSGRFQRYHELALIYAFVLDLAATP